MDEWRWQQCNLRRNGVGIFICTLSTHYRRKKKEKMARGSGGIGSDRRSRCGESPRRPWPVESLLSRRRDRHGTDGSWPWMDSASRRRGRAGGCGSAVLLSGNLTSSGCQIVPHSLTVGTCLLRAEQGLSRGRALGTLRLDRIPYSRPRTRPYRAAACCDANKVEGPAGRILMLGAWEHGILKARNKCEVQSVSRCLNKRAIDGIFFLV